MFVQHVQCEFGEISDVGDTGRADHGCQVWSLVKMEIVDEAGQGLGWTRCSSKKAVIFG